jgi:carbon-monoxide dehydrogenase medium subunit
MKPARFEYFAPQSIDEAVSLLSGFDGKETKVLAGGQSLLPMMNFRLTTPDVLIDLNRISDLAFIEERDGVLEIGAMTRQRFIEFSPVIAQHLPLLREAVRLVGHLPTRTRGTIGGSLAHADPSAEMCLMAVLLDAELVIRGPRAKRTVRAAEFFQSLMETALGPDEILTTIRLPLPSKGSGYAIEEVSRRSGDFAMASAAAIVGRLPTGDARFQVQLAVGGVGPVPIRLRQTEQLLARIGLGGSAIKDACAVAADELDPMADHNASAAFRRHLGTVLLERTLRKAIERCGA